MDPHWISTWISMRLAAAIGENAAEALALLAVAGVVSGLLRWHKAARRDFMASFIIFLLGTALAQLPVYLGGMVGWGVDLIVVSAAGRLVQNLGAVLFIRASLRDECGPWGWRTIVGVVLLLVWVL